MQNDIDSFLVKNGIKLYTNEHALLKKQALDFIDLIENENIFILDGDVWSKNSKGFFPQEIIFTTNEMNTL